MIHTTLVAICYIFWFWLGLQAFVFIRAITSDLFGDE
jgi:hypothetical protein